MRTGYENFANASRWGATRSLGIEVAINIIADPDWDEERFRILRDWCMDVPEVVNVSINTPYPGTETWLSDQYRLVTRDYRLFDIQTCRTADEATDCDLLPGAPGNPTGAISQAFELVDSTDTCARARAEPTPWTDQFHAWDLELSQGLRRR